MSGNARRRYDRLGPGFLSIWVLSLVWVCAERAGGAPDYRSDAVVAPRLLTVRQEYNETAAALDTIMRVYGRNRLERLADPERSLVEIPDEM